MQILSESNNIFFITKMLDNRHFPFTYNGDEIKFVITQPSGYIKGTRLNNGDAWYK